MSTTVEKKTISVPPFGIEIDHPQNKDILLQSTEEKHRLRSAISMPKPFPDAKSGKPCMPVDQVMVFGMFPEVPGMQVHVNPEKCTFAVIDPLHGDEKLCAAIRRHLNENSAFRVDEKLDGVPPQKGTLDEHRMKTLCRELLRIMDLGLAKMIKGPQPSIEDINELPGNYLLNPGARVPNMQPRYEEDFPGWVAELTRTGG